MAHFAELDANNIVKRVIVVNNTVLGDANGLDGETIGVEFCKSIFGADTHWVQCSYNSSFRAHYPGAGHVYDKEADAFYSQQPYKSWVLNKQTFIWEAPVPMPTDGKFYKWNEFDKSWAEVEAD